MTNAGTVPLNEVFTLAHTEFVTTDYLTDFGHSPTLLNFILFELLTETSRQGDPSFLYVLEYAIKFSFAFFHLCRLFAVHRTKVFIFNFTKNSQMNILISRWSSLLLFIKRGSLISSLLPNQTFTRFIPTCNQYSDIVVLIHLCPQVPLLLSGLDSLHSNREE